jgi:glucosamine 6-phosphate synthetase-like amidotransferase/phosphosugar isomerase protein
MGWPATAPEILAPVLAVVRGQQLALSLARLLGRDPDAPAGLSKVTST